MKKLVIKIILFALLVILIICSVFTFAGYNKYADAIKEQDIRSKVDEVVITIHK